MTNIITNGPIINSLGDQVTILGKGQNKGKPRCRHVGTDKWQCSDRAARGDVHCLNHIKLRQVRTNNIPAIMAHLGMNRYELWQKFGGESPNTVYVNLVGDLIDPPDLSKMTWATMRRAAAVLGVELSELETVEDPFAKSL